MVRPGRGICSIQSLGALGQPFLGNLLHHHAECIDLIECRVDVGRDPDSPEVFMNDRCDKDAVLVHQGVTSLPGSTPLMLTSVIPHYAESSSSGVQTWTRGLALHGGSTHRSRRNAAERPFDRRRCPREIATAAAIALWLAAGWVPISSYFLMFSD